MSKTIKKKLGTQKTYLFSRLKLLEKKKTEMALKSRKEIADYIAAGKPERAKIRVEHIIREDYYVEAMEIVEMYCDLLLARFGLIEQMKNLDDGLAESISSLIWVAPRLLGKIMFYKGWVYNFKFESKAKGQLISKFAVFNSSKKRTKKFQFLP